MNRPSSLNSPPRTAWASRRTWLIGLLLAIYVALRLRWFLALDEPANLTPGTYAVERVVDGDTLLLAGGIRIRLMGVNCPETVKPNAPIEPWGPEARSFTQAQIDTVAGQVRLEFDRERFDSYGRTLAFVWTGERLLNEELLRAGLARWEPAFNYSSSMKTRFRRAQEAAQQSRTGIWSPQP